jgi:hypothetical protein
MPILSNAWRDAQSQTIEPQDAHEMRKTAS